MVGPLRVLREGWARAGLQACSIDIGNIAPFLLEACQIKAGRFQDGLQGPFDAIGHVADRPFVDRWGLGLALPGGRPRAHLIRDGYLIEAESIAELASKMAVPADALGASIAEMNQAAVEGVDASFGKGSSEYNRYYGDPALKGNPCLGAVAEPPFYAVRVYPGDIGTASGLLTDPDGRVLGASGAPIAGLFCRGSDMASIMSGHYPGAGITLGPALTFGYRVGRAISAPR